MRNYVVSGVLYVIWIALMVLLSGQKVSAADYVFSWEAPTTNVDGTPLTDLSHYILSCGTTSTTASLVVLVGNVPSAPIAGIETHSIPMSNVFIVCGGGGLLFFSVRSVDLTGSTSVFSDLTMNMSVKSLQQITAGNKSNVAVSGSGPPSKTVTVTFTVAGRFTHSVSMLTNSVGVFSGNVDLSSLPDGALETTVGYGGYVVFAPKSVRKDGVPFGALSISIK